MWSHLLVCVIEKPSFAWLSTNSLHGRLQWLRTRIINNCWSTARSAAFCRSAFIVGSVGYGLWTAWISDLLSHMIVADVHDLVVDQCKALARATLNLPIVDVRAIGL